MKNTIILLLALGMLAACTTGTKKTVTEDTQKTAEVQDTLRYEQEAHLKNIRQLTFGGDNAEAYFSFDDRYLVMQRTNKDKGIPCDQIYYGDLQDPEFKMNLISTGKGRTTCSYFMPGDETIIFASTHKADDACPPPPDITKVKRYVWPIYPTFELYISDKEGNILNQLTDNDYYDAEATVSAQGDKIVFTSTRDGDLDLYTMDIDGSNVNRVTTGLGYDGGAFFSPDGTKLIFRSSRPKTETEIAVYKSFLSKDLVAPTNMELYVCNVDGSDLKQIAELGKANWAPFFHPSGEKVIFCSNHSSESGRQFNLFMMNLDGTGVEQVTYDSQFDSFPMFSYDGKKLVFASNRNNGGTRETNVFIADWVE
ncbi:hypothetical protein N9933_02870 [bacterium]|nr:hypothetical protein [bacterium]